MAVVPREDVDRRAREAEHAALLYEQYHGSILAYCLYHLRSREEAEDAAQTTFLHAFRGLRRGVVPQAESAWLITIAKNVCRSRHRTARRRRVFEAPRDLVSLQEVLPAAEPDGDDLIGLDDALAGMPEKQRRAILLREWQGLSYSEIADRLRLSDSAVTTLLFRARRSLAQNLGGDAEARRRRLARAFDFGPLVAGLKSALAGGSAVKLVAAVAAVATTAAAGASALSESTRSATQADDVASRAGLELAAAHWAKLVAQRRDVGVQVTPRESGASRSAERPGGAKMTKHAARGADGRRSRAASAPRALTPAEAAAATAVEARHGGAGGTAPPKSQASGSATATPPLPSVEAPAIQPPSVDAPAIQALSAEVPSIQAPSAELPSIQAPSVQAPSIQAPSAELPSIQAPSIQAPSLEAPKLPQVPSLPSAPSLPVEPSVPTVKAPKLPVP